MKLWDVCPKVKEMCAGCPERTTCPILKKEIQEVKK